MRYFLFFLSLIFAIHCSSSKIQLKGEMHIVETEDNWKISLEHFAPLPGTKERSYPIIICHGLIGTRDYFKQNEEESLVYQLQNQGYDVWLIELRGRETVGKPSILFGKNKYADINFDKFIKYDVDRAIGFVLQKTGKEKVNWLGHSMGGMVIYARAGSLGETRIANLVTIGSPFSFPYPPGKLKLMTKFNFGLSVLPNLPAASVSSFESSTGIRILTSDFFLGLFYYQKNLTPDQNHRLLQYGVSNESTEVFRQFANAVEGTDYRSHDTLTSYTQNLKNFTIPTFLVAGRRDHLGTPSIVRHVYDSISSSDKTFFMVGRSEGHTEDYGHVDLINGKGIQFDVIPPILKWLNERNGK